VGKLEFGQLIFRRRVQSVWVTEGKLRADESYLSGCSSAIYCLELNESPAWIRLPFVRGYEKLRALGIDKSFGVQQRCIRALHKLFSLFLDNFESPKCDADTRDSDNDK
jgi:hypothetical protein